MKPLIYIILPVYNRINKVKEFINCIEKQSYQNFHLILVDDNSRDGTANYVQRRIRNVTIIHGNGNLWWAGALKQAYLYLKTMRFSQDDIVWIANDDITFDSEYFRKLIEDNDLKINTLVISPGKCDTTGFIEHGFLIDWSKMKFKKLQSGGIPDAVTTRGLYMKINTYLSIPPTSPIFLPHYLSDLEYTIRAKRLGYNLKVSKFTIVNVDRNTTGIHVDCSNNIREFIYHNLLSKKTAFNYFYLGNFILLACPLKYKILNILKNYFRFFKKATKFFLKRHNINC